jgi:acyl-ACP thioesterase
MMSFVHTVDFSVTALHADCFGRARPSALLRFAQEAAESHCLLLGTDWDTMAGKGLFWAVIRQRMEITRLPRTGETVTVKTWPMPTSRVAYPRATAGYDEAGNELFRVISLWVIMDRTSRAMIRPDKSGVEVLGETFGTELKAPAGLPAGSFENHQLRSVCFSDLDVNGHMNNTRYLDWLCDLVPAPFHREHPVKAFTICYMNEALEGQQLQLSWTTPVIINPSAEVENGGILRVDGDLSQTDVDTGHTRIFSAQVEF